MPEDWEKSNESVSLPFYMRLERLSIANETMKAPKVKRKIPLRRFKELEANFVTATTMSDAARWTFVGDERKQLSGNNSYVKPIALCVDKAKNSSFAGFTAEATDAKTYLLGSSNSVIMPSKFLEAPPPDLAKLIELQFIDGQDIDAILDNEQAAQMALRVFLRLLLQEGDNDSPPADDDPPQPP